jgi:hypothetical protein
LVVLHRRDGLVLAEGIPSVDALPRLARESHHFLTLPAIRPERTVLSGEAGLIASLEKALKEAGLPRTRADIRKAIEAGPVRVASLHQDLVKASAAAHAGDGTKSPKPPTLVSNLGRTASSIRPDMIFGKDRSVGMRLLLLAY